MGADVESLVTEVMAKGEVKISTRDLSIPESQELLARGVAVLVDGDAGICLLVPEQRK